jgi:sugar phosphate isomerase/epimerase
MENQISRRQALGQIIAAAATTALAPALLRGAPADEKKDPWQIGCFTRPWKDDPYTVAFDAIAEAGYRYVGFMTTKLPGGYIITTRSSPEQAAKAGEEAHKRGLTVLAAWGGGLPVAKAGAEGVASGVAALHRLIDNANAGGVGTLLMGGTTKSEEYANYYKAIEECCDYAAEKKVALVMKPHGGLNSTGPQCKKTIKMVNKKNFRLWYDPGNIFFYSAGALDPVTDAPAVAGIVSGMCVKDFKPPMDVDVTPGDGKVNFQRVMNELRQGGFTSGPLVVETLGPGGDPKQKIAQAKKARELVERMVANA